MRLLLDTHIFIWWDSAPEKLPARTRALCQDRQHELLLSVASVWEMQIKAQLGKLSLKLPLAELVQGQQRTNQLTVLPIQLETCSPSTASRHTTKTPSIACCLPKPGRSR